VSPDELAAAEALSSLIQDEVLRVGYIKVLWMSEKSPLLIAAVDFFSISTVAVTFSGTSGSEGRLLRPRMLN